MNSQQTPPAEREPIAKIVRLHRQGDALQITFGMQNIPQIDRWAESYASRLQDQHLQAMAGQVEDWTPVHLLRQARAQVQGVRGLQLNAQAAIARANAELAGMRADLHMPGQLKLAKEREIQGRLTAAMQEEQRFDRDAQELEARMIPTYRAAVDKMYNEIANRANQAAALDLRHVADNEVRRWAEQLPAGALFLIEHCGAGAVARMVSNLEKAVESKLAQPAQVQIPDPTAYARAAQQRKPSQYPVDQAEDLGLEITTGTNPSGEVVHSIHVPTDQAAKLGGIIARLSGPDIRVEVANLHNNGWMILAIEAPAATPDGRPRLDPPQAMNSQGPPQGKVIGIDFFGELLRDRIADPAALGDFPPNEPRNFFQLTPQEMQEAGYQSEPIKLNSYRRMTPGEIRDASQGQPEHFRRNATPQAESNQPAFRPGVLSPSAFPAFQPNWPPQEEAQPQVGSVDANDPFDPYTVAQQAAAQARHMLANGYQPPVIESTAATDAPATIAFDATNGGYNRPPGSPLVTHADVDVAVNALQSNSGLFAAGPVTELDPNDFPV